MPIYLCKPGWSMPEPWRHGLQVYAYPFPIDYIQQQQQSSPSFNTTASRQRNNNNNNNTRTTTTTTTLSVNSNLPITNVATTTAPATTHNDNREQANNNNEPVRIIEDENRQENNNDNRNSNTTTTASSTTTPYGLFLPNNDNSGAATINNGLPIRRIRHAEIILVDEICSYYGRYWLRLRWPGAQGGFAGYIALGSVTNANSIGRDNATTAMNVNKLQWNNKDNNDDDDSNNNQIQQQQSDNNQQATAAATHEEHQEEEEEDTIINEIQTSTPPSQEVSLTTKNKSMMLRCPTTELYYPSSSAMELLYQYDDGISSSSLFNQEDEDPQQCIPVNSVSVNPLVTGMGDEHVFCRICREGLHDISYDPSTTGGTTTPFEQPTQQPVSDHNVTDHNTVHNPPQQQQVLGQQRPNRSDDEGSPPPTRSHNTHPSHNMALLHEATSSHPTAENPMLAPCECSGSIAFVHYLCIEQWRCRSRHPNAKNGLNCETCGGTYTLPPPPSRPVDRPNEGNGGALLDDDWLEAMPAHVLAALRRPHFWWSVGAGLVRHKRLRPFVPIVISPIVALYCRARRMLKKRGVSRRRWACSLCGRRARWKCVRCLRSYYCSRQCQNVSWHIVHKHVCYKPVRFWWSVVFYSLLTVITIPGIIRNPLVYGTGLASIPASFLVVGILSGYFASITKKLLKIDIRGRILEMSVVICTLKVAYASWAITQAFFGITTNNCSNFRCTSIYSIAIIKLAHNTILYPIYRLLTIADRLVLQKTSILSFLCKETTNNINQEQYYCLESIQNADSNLGGKCKFDIILLSFLWLTAALVTLSSMLFKKNRDHNNNNNNRGRGGRGRAVIIQHIGGRAQAARPHQD